MFKVSKRHCLFNSNCSTEITLGHTLYTVKHQRISMKPTGLLKHPRALIIYDGPTVKVWHVETRNVVMQNDYAVTKRNCTTFRLPRED